MVLVLAYNSFGFCQEINPQISFDYTLMPATSENISAQLFDASLAIPLEFGALNIKPIVGLRNYDFEYWEGMSFNTEPVERIHNIYSGVDINYSLDKSWELGGGVEVSNASNLDADQYVITGNAHLKYNFKTVFPVAVEVGALYDSPLGKLEFLPTVALTTTYRKYQIQLGFPKSSLQYKLSENSMLETAYTFEGDYFHLADELIFNSVEPAREVGLSQQKLSLGYTYNLDPNWSFSLSGGYLLKNELSFYTGNDDTIYDLDLGAGPVFSTGIKFNFFNK